MTRRPCRSPLGAHYDAETLARQSEYHACCQRTAAHRFDCSTVIPERREQAVRGVGRAMRTRRVA